MAITKPCIPSSTFVIVSWNILQTGDKPILSKPELSAELSQKCSNQISKVDEVHGFDQTHISDTSVP
jgi:hypothetical protein